MKIAVILQAYDNMSKTFNTAISQAQGKLNVFAKKADNMAEKSFKTGQQLAAAGLAVAAPLIGMVKLYADLEDAQLSLKSTMMDANGRVLPIFNDLNKLAIDLGNQLPGNTADFYQMFNTMITNGARADDIIQGLGKSTAFLAVQLKLPYDMAAELATRLQVATGVANQDMMEFNDMLARIKQLGPNVDEMQYAFQRSAGQLKAMKIQGLDAMKELGPAFAILIRTMGSGERVGTNFSALLSSFQSPKILQSVNALGREFGIALNFVDKNGDFLGTTNMIEQFDKLRNLTTVQRNKFVAAIAGDKGTDTQILNTLISEGLPGYNKMIQKMKEQADLNRKVQSQLGSLKNKWDALVGTFQNAAAEVGAKLAPQLKQLFDTLNNKIIPAVSGFIQRHPTLIMFLLKSAILFSAVALAGSYLSFVVGGVAKFFGFAAKAARILLNVFKFLRAAFILLRLAILAFPVVGWIMLIATAAFFIIKYWDKVKLFFVWLWEGIKKIFWKVVAWIKEWGLLFLGPVGFIIKYWNQIIDFFSFVPSKMAVAGKNIIMSLYKGIMSVLMLPYNAVKGMVKKIRDLLPFSPAKEGPLRDIHRIKLVETIAEGVKPASLVNAVRKTAGLAVNVLNNPGSLAPRTNNYGTGFNFSFTIHNFSGGATKEDAAMLGNEMKKQFDQWMRQYKNQQARAGF